LYKFTPDSKFVLVTGMIALRKGNVVTDFLGQYLPAFQLKGVPWVARLWDVQTGQQVASFTDCRQMCYSSGAKILVTAHEHGIVKVWEVPPRKPVVTILGVSLVLWFALLLGPFSRRFVRRAGLNA
jgi:hypothetical protein